MDGVNTAANSSEVIEQLHVECATKLTVFQSRVQDFDESNDILRRRVRDLG